MFNTTINDNSKNTGFFNNNLKNEVNITTKKGLFKTKVTVSSSKEIKRKKENDRMLDFNKIETCGLCFSSSISSGKKKPSLFNKKKEGISMNKNLVKVLVAGAVVVGVAVAGAVVITKKVKARKARKAEEVKDENINEEVEEEVTEEEVSEEEAGEETVEEETEEEEVSENEEVEEDETDDEDDDEVPVIVEKVVVRIAHYVGIGIGILLGRLLLKDTIRLEEATKCL